jgi:hypothetical protein
MGCRLRTPVPAQLLRLAKFDQLATTAPSKSRRGRRGMIPVRGIRREGGGSAMVLYHRMFLDPRTGMLDLMVCVLNTFRSATVPSVVIRDERVKSDDVLKSLIEPGPGSTGVLRCRESSRCHHGGRRARDGQISIDF